MSESAIGQQLAEPDPDGRIAGAEADLAAEHARLQAAWQRVSGEYAATLDAVLAATATAVGTVLGRLMLVAGGLSAAATPDEDAAATLRQLRATGATHAQPALPAVADSDLPGDQHEEIVP